ncbi:MAG: DUF2007 domain-containing protein [Bryobacteraceae bacterium]
MFCPACGEEYRDGFVECADCRVPLTDQRPQLGTNTGEHDGEEDLDVLIRTGLIGPLAIGLARTLLEEAGIPFFAMDLSTAARQESGNFLGWWNVRVSHDREAEAREVLRSVETAK